MDGRYDGSSKFQYNQRYGFFPSVSAGWRIAKESFWNVDPNVVSDLKIRGSYGSLGNGNIPSYAFQENFNISQSERVVNGVRSQQTSAPGVIPAQLTWETATTADLGLDFSALSSRLSFTGDIYVRTTTNMFTVGKTLPAIFGTTVPKGNYADMRTNGWEASISWRDQFTVASKPFHYNAGFWMSDYHAEITRYNNTTKLLSDYYAGEKLGEIWGYTNDGYWTDTDYKQAAAFQPIFKASNSGEWLPGDIKFKDINGKKVINNLTKSLDVENIGKSDVILTGASNNGNGNNYPILKSVSAGLSITL